MSNIKEKTVSFIIKEFNNKNINYAIARNYETFPLFKSDLDIFYENSGDIQSATFYTVNDLINTIKVEEEKIGNIEDTKQKLRQENKVENLKKILTTMNEEMDDNMIGYYQSIREKRNQV